MKNDDVWPYHIHKGDNTIYLWFTDGSMIEVNTPADLQYESSGGKIKIDLLSKVDLQVIISTLYPAKRNDKSPLRKHKITAMAAVIFAFAFTLGVFINAQKTPTVQPQLMGLTPSTTGIVAHNSADNFSSCGNEKTVKTSPEAERAIYDAEVATKLLNDKILQVNQQLEALSNTSKSASYPFGYTQ